MDLLALYGLEYNAGVLATDSISAIYYTGEMDYWDCTSSCVGLSGNWKVLDQYLVGSYKQELANQGTYVWLDFNNSPHAYYGNNTYVPYVYTLNWNGRNTVPNSEYTCFCQTRTRADIEDINLCEGLEDECGVCNGEGAIYECGCADIPEGDCDCNGNQLDAVGVCGGDCLEDLDGDGVCDPVLGPCEGQDFVSYNGYDYDIVETADGRCWFAENLKTTTFANGEDLQISYGNSSGGYLSGVDWHNLRGTDNTIVNSQSGVYVIESNGAIPTGDNVSMLYNFTAIVDDNGLCPIDWHVPSINEFETLFDSYGGINNASLSLKSSAIDECASSVIYNPSGLEVDSRFYVTWNNSGYDWITSQSILSTSTYYNTNSLIYPNQSKRVVIYNCGVDGSVDIQTTFLNHGSSVRCIKD
jgi:uncharacterized protein (TIGR02145 family)